MKRTNVLHIATHGFFLSDKDADTEEYTIENNPLMRSGLLLTGSQASFVNNRVVFNSNRQEDGVLTASEVLNMNLKGTDLVVLSACETGLGEVINGEGVYGLQRALIIAGANSVIMSLWRVDDVVTKELMIKFYKYYLGGRNKFESLTLAQKEIRNNQNLPYYWGAFVLTGI
jgi:CHAT domain-containing protein